MDRYELDEQYDLYIMSLDINEKTLSFKDWEKQINNKED